MFKDFKKFISRGNVVDLAIGLVIGTAFGAIVKSFVSDIINPILGLFVGNTDLSNYKLVIKKATENSEAITINYGAFATTVINFLILAFVLFLIIKSYNKFKEEVESLTKSKEEEIELAKEVKLSLQEELLTQIRDILNEKNK